LFTKDQIKSLPIVGRFTIDIRDAWRKQAAKQKLSRQPSPLRIVVGASGKYNKNWIPTDQSFLDIAADADWSKWFKPNSIEAILAEHVWEHLPASSAISAVRLCFQYLRPGGYLRLAVPDGNHPSPSYIREVEPGGVGSGAMDHKVLYTYETLSQLLGSEGFAIEPLEYFDKDGVFHEFPWSLSNGTISRSRRLDSRNAAGELAYTSLILDARKPQ
jgi:predicted SAM-dependent methyltransferase